ncbi:MAG: acireductone synthase, partial [Planctomycetota bacterium]
MTNCSSDDCGCIETIGDNAAAILLDIEGTTSSISFVVDVMFPNVRENLASYLTDHHGSPDTRAAIDQIAIDADGEHASAESKFGDLADTNVQEQIARHVFSLMDDDVKSTGLKQLQGMIWKTGFQSGQMRAHLFDDVLPSMQRWIDQGKTIWIYSSGSVAAQLLFFGHTIHGDLLPMISGHWDT